MKQNILETIVGFAVLVITAIFITFAYKTSGTSNDSKGYVLQAQFQTAEGITPGSDVMISGIKIGSIKNITLDKDNFLANVIITVSNNITLPKDSKASVVTSGLLGGKYINITPGSSEENLAANDKIIYTQSAINLESLISKIIYSFGGSK